MGVVIYTHRGDNPINYLEATEMTTQERTEIERRIDVMVGSREQQRKITEAMSLEDRINSNNRYNKVRAQLFKIAEKEGLKALASVVITGGKWCEGCTASGKKYVL